LKAGPDPSAKRRHALANWITQNDLVHVAHRGSAVLPSALLFVRRDRPGLLQFPKTLSCGKKLIDVESAN
jgi:hypothetical protein